jgi:hypothetical protein
MAYSSITLNHSVGTNHCILYAMVGPINYKNSRQISIVLVKIDDITMNGPRVRECYRAVDRLAILLRYCSTVARGYRSSVKEALKYLIFKT